MGSVAFRLITVCKSTQAPKLEIPVFFTTSSSSISFPACVYAHSLSHVQLFVAPWTIAHQALLSMGFPRQEHWSGYCPHPGMEPSSLASPALADRFFTTSATQEVLNGYKVLSSTLVILHRSISIFHPHWHYPR